MNKTTICVLIRVKNNAHNMLQILNSTLPYATDYIIHDYNSLDNTVNICNKFFFDNNIRGQIFYTEPGHSHQFDQYLLDFGRKCSTSEYLWLYDSNKIINGILQIPKLTQPCYGLNNKHPLSDINMIETCIFDNKIEWKEKGYVATYIEPMDENIICEMKLIRGDYYLS